MRVKFINSIAGVNFSYSAGQISDLTKERYNEVKAHCEIVKDEKPKPKAKKGVREL
jgi:hypothetical protein